MFLGGDDSKPHGPKEPECGTSHDSHRGAHADLTENVGGPSGKEHSGGMENPAGAEADTKDMAQGFVKGVGLHTPK